MFGFIDLEYDLVGLFTKLSNPNVSSKFIIIKLYEYKTSFIGRLQIGTRFDSRMEIH